MSQKYLQNADPIGSDPGVPTSWKQGVHNAERGKG